MRSSSKKTHFIKLISRLPQCHLRFHSGRNPEARLVTAELSSRIERSSVPKPHCPGTRLPAVLSSKHSELVKLDLPFGILTKGEQDTPREDLSNSNYACA
jgi:hypothetical protein